MKWFADLPLKKKFALSFISILLAIIVIFSLSLMVFQNLKKGMAESEDHYSMVVELDDYIEAHLNWVSQLKTAVIRQDSFKGQLDPTQCTFGKWYYDLMKNDTKLKALGNEQIEILKSLEEPHKMLHISAEGVMTSINDGMYEEAVETFESVTEKHLNNVLVGLNSLKEAEMKGVAVIREENSATMKMSMIAMSCVVATVFIFVGIIIFLMIKTIYNPVVTVSGLISDTSRSKNLTLTLDMNQRDEIGKMSEAFRQMMSELGSIIHETKDNAENLASMSVELASSTEEMSSTSNEIASAVQETNRSMESSSAAVTEMASNIQNLSHTIKTMAEYFEQITMATNEGAHSVSNAVTSMDQIKTSSEKIANIINVITEIAGQTNLLSLNAAIEAAKAGEMGKGFAVVAEEVRKLAERSAGAAKEISELIHESTRLVDGGAETIGSAGQALEDILGKVGETSALVSEISTASEEQSRGVESIVEATDNVANLASQNASAIEQVAATVSEISRTVGEVAQLSDHQRDVMDQFTV